MSGRSARRAGIALALGLVLGPLVLTGCAGTGTASPAATSPSPTPIARLNTSSLEVPRIEFCALVPKDAVTAALGAAPADTATWGNGDTEPASGLTGDVLHELGCAWSAANGTTARAWIFARPVDARFARTTIRASSTTKGCRRVTGPAFGDPAYTQECTLAGEVARIRHAGLFGQTWLTCEVAGPGGMPIPEVRERADAWCVEVAEALDTGR